jgi:hypothetical protein
MAYFEGLIETEDGAPVEVAFVGTEPFYVVDDQGFRRHIDAEDVDRAVLDQFLGQLREHSDEASRAMLQLMGQDDLFAKAAVDATIRNADVEQVRQQGLPPEARQWLSMLGFRVIINYHGEVVSIKMPAGPEPDDEE